MVESCFFSVVAVVDAAVDSVVVMLCFACLRGVQHQQQLQNASTSDSELISFNKEVYIIFQ